MVINPDHFSKGSKKDLENEWPVKYGSLSKMMLRSAEDDQLEFEVFYRKIVLQRWVIYLVGRSTSSSTQLQLYNHPSKKLQS